MNPIENSAETLSSDNIGAIIVELDGEQLQEGPSDPEKRRAMELALRRTGEQYLEKLRIYHPAEYEEIMKAML